MLYNWWQKFKKLNPLVKILLAFVAVVLGLSFLFAPGPPAAKNWQEASFSTTADARLYFHNVRSFYYNLDARSKKPMRIFSLRRRDSATDAKSLQFNIIQHPSSDEAFIYTQLGNAFEQDTSLAVYNNVLKYRVALAHLTSEEHYKIAASVYKALQENEPVYLLQGNDTLADLYSDPQSRINAEITLEDYFTFIFKN